jgi:hypothetical protein
MTPAEDTLARIKARREEQARLYRILDLWAAVQAQGTEPEEIQSFGFDPKLLTPTLEREHWQGAARGHDPYVERLPTGQHRPLIFNYVRLKVGGIRALHPVLEAVY